MQYTQFDKIYLLRMDRGEEIHSTLEAFCRQHSITAGWLTGIGALMQAELGYFNRERKEYSWKVINTDHELTSLAGNISIKDGEPWLHLHATLSDDNFQVTAGHLKSGVISITGEIWIQRVEGMIERQLNPEFQSYLLSVHN